MLILDKFEKHLSSRLNLKIYFNETRTLDMNLLALNAKNIFCITSLSFRIFFMHVNLKSWLVLIISLILICLSDEMKLHVVLYHLLDNAHVLMT